MRDIPVFTTENGVATLFLKNVPATKTAYIKVQDSHNVTSFLHECCDFCRAVGADRVYATGTDSLIGKHSCEQIISMTRAKEDLPNTNARLVPVQVETMNQWREIYNRKMRGIPNASQITQHDASKYLDSGTCYFVYDGSVLIGIGTVSENRIEALASVVKGAGRDVLLALCQASNSDLIELSVASSNEKAVGLYKSMGFTFEEVLETWYQII